MNEEQALAKEKALQELVKLRKDSTKFYASRAGKAQLKWLDEFEANLIKSAISAGDSTMRLSCLDQAKGLRAFRGYLNSLTKPEDIASQAK